MKTLLYVIGIIVVLNALLSISLLIRINNISAVPSFGGTTHLGGLELAETLSVTGATTLTGATTITGNIISNGGIITGGGLALGAISSTSLTAAQFCDYSYITANVIGDDDNDQYSASISLPTEALLIADCLDTVGDCKKIKFENITSAAASLELYLGDTNALVMHFTSSSYPNIEIDNFVELEACAVAGTDTASISWNYNPITIE